MQCILVTACALLGPLETIPPGGSKTYCFIREMVLISWNGSHIHQPGWVPQETDFEMEIYALEVYWRGLLGREGNRIVQWEMLDCNIVETGNLSQSNWTSSVAGE